MLKRGATCTIIFFFGFLTELVQKNSGNFAFKLLDCAHMPSALDDKAARRAEVAARVAKAKDAMNQNATEASILSSRNECPGTFRWPAKKKVPVLPPFPVGRKDDGLRGWGPYLKWRGGSPLVKEVQSDPSLLDAFSFPVTLFSALSSLEMAPGPRLTVVVCGAARRAEERVLRETSLWQEIKHRYDTSHVELWLVGPEMSSSETPPLLSQPEGFKAQCFKGSVLEWNKQHPLSDPSSAVFISYNAGFGNFADPESGRFELLFSWLPSLEVMLNTGCPLVFTCANDYGDVRGEVATMDLLGVHWLADARQNVVSFATTLVGEGVQPGQESSSESWSRGNSHWYAVQNSSEFAQSALLETKSSEAKKKKLLLSHLVARTLPSPSSVVKVANWGVDSVCAVRSTATAVIDSAPFEVTCESKEVFVTVRTKDMTSMVEAHLELTPSKLFVKWATGQAEADLPCLVMPNEADATFSKRRQLLSVRIPKV